MRTSNRRIFYVLSILVAMLLSIFTLGFSTEYYIKPAGDDAKDGETIGNAWQTMSKANATLIAGDTVYVLAGSYMGANNRINPTNSGSDGNPITYTNYQSDLVTLRGTGGDAIILTGNSYITIDSINVDGENPRPGATIDSWVVMENLNSHHNIVQNCTMEYANAWSGVVISNGAHHNKILNNVLSKVGISEPPAANDVGDLIYVGLNVHHNLIEGNEVFACGHNLFVITAEGGGNTANYNIVRNNDFHNGFVDVDNWRGGRCVAIVPENGECKWNLIEGNIIRDSSLHQNDDPAHPNIGMKSVGSNNIVRRNRIYNNIGNGIRISSSLTQTPQDNRVYHNSIYHNGHGGSTAKTGIAWHKWNGVFGGDVYKNNILYDNNAGNYFFGGGANAGWFTFANNHEAGDPKFVDADNGDFHLESDSPCRDAGAFLTLTSGASTGTSMTVDDAGYFCDGFEMIEGDVIQLDGQTVTATIALINYGTNVLTLEAPGLTWDDNQGVALLYYGSAPEQGAYEYPEVDTSVLRIKEILRIKNVLRIK